MYASIRAGYETINNPFLWRRMDKELKQTQCLPIKLSIHQGEHCQASVLVASGLRCPFYLSLVAGYPPIVLEYGVRPNTSIVGLGTYSSISVSISPAIILCT